MTRTRRPDSSGWVAGTATTSLRVVAATLARLRASMVKSSSSLSATAKPARDRGADPGVHAVLEAALAEHHLLVVAGDEDRITELMRAAREWKVAASPDARVAEAEGGCA